MVSPTQRRMIRGLVDPGVGVRRPALAARGPPVADASIWLPQLYRSTIYCQPALRRIVYRQSEAGMPAGRRKKSPVAARTRGLDRKECEILAAFRYTLRRFLSFSEAAAGEVGLAPQQYQALLAIKGCAGRESVTINELAQQLLIKHNSAVGLVDRLENEGLVTRKTALEDRRKVNVKLTAKGSRIFGKLAAAHRLELQRVGPDLSRFLAYFSRPQGEAAPPDIGR